MLRESGPGEARWWRRWHQEHEREPERIGCRRSPREARGHERDRWGRKDRDTERCAEGNVVVATPSAARHLLEEPVALVWIAHGATATASSHSAMARVSFWAAEHAREDRKRARERHRQDEREHQEVPPPPARGGHAPEHTRNQERGNDSPTSVDAHGRESAALQAEAEAWPWSHVVMHTSRGSPWATTVPPLWLSSPRALR